MSNPIGYVDCTWNPLAMRCTPVSEACGLLLGHLALFC
jgi:hypothetical protein